MAGYVQNLGINDLTFGPIMIDYGPKGMTSRFTVTCPTIGPLINYYNYIVRTGASGRFLGCDVGADGFTSAEVKSLEVSVPGLVNNLGSVLSELYFDQWELLTNETTDSIFNNPLIVGETGWMTDNDKTVLSFVQLKSESVAQAIADCNAEVSAGNLNPPVTGGASGLYTNLGDPRSQQILKEILKGQVEFQRPAYVLRHTSYCSAGATYNTGIAGVQCIYSPSQLLSEVGNGWTYNLPGRLYSEIAAIPYQQAPQDEAPYYTWGWLKTISRETVLSNFVIERSTEYSAGLWSNLRYALA